MTNKTEKKKGKGVGKLATWIVVLAVVLAGVVFGGKLLQKGGIAPRIEFQKGMGYVTWSQEGYSNPSSDESLQQLKDLGVEWVAILVTWYQTNCWSSDMHSTNRTPTDEAIVHAIRKAHELGMKVVLKPHLDLLDTSDGSWRGEIGCLRDPDWDKWFSGYTDYLMHYVDIANNEKVEMICIGTELSTTTAVKGYMWRDLIKKVRSKYGGLLMYAAHWDRYLDIRFWDLLDYVGVNAYFPLTEEMDPTPQQLKDGLVKWVNEMEEFQKEVGKPIIFPEAGCNSADGAAIRPWEHAPRKEINLDLQKEYYEVFFETFWNKEWFYGFYWWYWGTNINMGGKYNRGFTPQNKPAQEVLKEWYSKRSPR
ncbi:MAG: hypothetical protein WBB86_00385 [Candidatus Omnitrophota bacterium]